MADVIAWKTAEEIIKILASENALVAGMSIEEAAAAYGYTLTSSGMYVKSIADVASVAGSAATAGEAIAGTAATGGAATTAANLTLYTTAEGTTAVGGLGSIALPIAACALAGAGGYALGNITGEYINEKYPDFFDGMFSSISKFLTGDERSLAFIFDEKGEIFMPQASVEEINKYLENSLSDKENTSATSGDITISFKEVSLGDKIYCTDLSGGWYYEAFEIISEAPVYGFGYCEGTSDPHSTTVLFSKYGFKVKFHQYRKEGSSWHQEDDSYWETSSNEGENPEPSSVITGSGVGLSYLATNPNLYQLPINIVNGPYYKWLTAITHEAIYGNVSSTGKTPKSLEKKYEVPNKPTIEVPSQYPTWTPVTLPSTSPSGVPTEFPDPNADTDASKITPYIPQPQPYPEELPVVQPSTEPNPNPITIPVPSYELTPQPTPSPDADPSAEPVTKPKPDPTPQPTPEDTGSTPKPSVPIIPTISSSATGLLHVYNPTNEQINEFGSWLWTTFSGDLIDTIAKLFNNPMDAVIGLHELYCTPSTGDNTTIKAGFLDSGVASRLVSSRYVNVDCGAITVPEYWGNYLDYSPYTKVYCYLPFIGIVELNADDIIGHGVQIDYKVDTYNGSCIAMIITAKSKEQESTTYQFSGNCAVEVPITSGMKSAIQSALIGAATCAIGVAGGAAIGGKIASSAMLQAGAAKGGMVGGLNSKNTVSHSGTFGSSFGAMGIKKPYIIVKRPVQKVVAGYNKNYGYPAHKMVTIGNCSGYLRCRDFEVVSSTATEEEKKRIEILLKDGVYV